MMYRTVTATLLRCREASIIVKVKNRPGEHVIPRSLLHGGDDLRVARLSRNAVATFRVMDWKAEELGLA